MATIPPGSIQQSRFIGTPIMVPVQADSPVGNVTFHRVRLKVTVGDGGGAITQNDAEFEFSTPVSNGEVTWFDISSAFRAFADTYSPTPTAYTYPQLAANLNACDDYMIDGVSYEDMSPSETVQVTGKYLGALTDRERGAGVTGQWSEPARYSRKPTTSPEICYYKPNAQGQPEGSSKHLQPGITGINPPSVTAVTVPKGFAVGSNIYGIPAPQFGHEIRFINSLGVHENIFVSGLPTKEVNITTEKYTIARQETLTSFSRGLAMKSNDYETWQFSTGPLDEAWTSWYIHEFLMARWVWIDINGLWIPCHVLPEETTTIVSREKAEMLEVQFKLQLDINGSPL
ncbi:MAG: hypothetical protein IKR31_03295 [Prevotella sp.]|nr:hypothetical protein [Prevotella sp.]